MRHLDRIDGEKYLGPSIEDILKEPNWETVVTSEPYNFRVVRDGDYVIIKYKQIDTDFNQLATQESRGMIIHEPTMEIVCRPFHKFYNWQEGRAANIQSNAAYAPKLDGSLIKIWKHLGKVHVSTNGSIDAYKTPNLDNTGTFGDFVERSIRDMGRTFEDITSRLEEGNTLMFELTTPGNMVVIYSEEYKLRYILSRNLKGEYDYDDELGELFQGVEWKPLKKSIEELSQVANKEAEEELIEGYVIIGEYGKLVKVKTIPYVSMHYFATSYSATNNRIVKSVLMGEIEEVVSVRKDLEPKLRSTLANIGLIDILVGVLTTDCIRHGDGNRRDIFMKVNELEPKALQTLVKRELVMRLDGKEIPVTSRSIVDAYEKMIFE